MAISVGIGLALAAKERKSNKDIYILMGDGELNEGSIWEAFMAAPHFKLDNLTAIIDRNHLSYDGNTEDVMPSENLADKRKSFNWFVSECDGHSVESLLKAFSENEEGKPHIIIADTIKGKGVSFAEAKGAACHHFAITQEEFEIAKKEIMG